MNTKMYNNKKKTHSTFSLFITINGNIVVQNIHLLLVLYFTLLYLTLHYFFVVAKPKKKYIIY